MDDDWTGAGEVEARLDIKEAITLALHYTRIVTDGDFDDPKESGRISNEDAISVAQVYAILALARAVEGLSAK